MSAETLVLSIASLLAGGVASVTGFGIGSILTPTASLWMDGRLAVPVVSIPHLMGTVVRFSMVKGSGDRPELWASRQPVVITSAGVVVGTIAGARLLRNVPEPVFRRVVVIALAILGVALWLRATA